MQYEIELTDTFGTIAFKFICIIFFFNQMIMVWKPGTVWHLFITADSL